MTKCIYCRSVDVPFNREHVFHEAFGVFKDNFVLACVCKGCNDYFGNSIDRTLTRDSSEAVARIHERLKKPEEWKGEGKRSTLRFEPSPNGPFRGAPAHVVAAPKGGQTLGVTAAPRVGFVHEGKPPHWFAIDQIPTPDDLIARGFPRDGGVTFRVEGSLDLDEVRSTLEAKGYAFDGDFMEVPPRELGPVAGEIVFNVSEPHFRAITKIALNYLARTHDADLVLRPEFDGARRFVRYDEHVPHLAPCENPWFSGRRGHYASITRWEEIIVVQLSVLMRVQYFVRLSTDGRDVPITPVAHLFDLDSNEIEEIEPLPIKRGRPLDVAK